MSFTRPQVSPTLDSYLEYRDETDFSGRFNIAEEAIPTSLRKPWTPIFVLNARHSLLRLP